MFAVFAVLKIIPLKSGTAVASRSLADGLSSVGLLLSVNTAYLAFIVLVFLFVIQVSINPDMVAASPLLPRLPPDGRLPAWLGWGAAGLRWTRGSRLFTQTGWTKGLVGAFALLDGRSSERSDDGRVMRPVVVTGPRPRGDGARINDRTLWIDRFPSDMLCAQTQT